MEGEENKEDEGRRCNEYRMEERGRAEGRGEILGVRWGGGEMGRVDSVSGVRWGGLTVCQV